MNKKRIARHGHRLSAQVSLPADIPVDIPADIADALYAAIAPLALDPTRAERMRRRTLDALRDENIQNDYLTIHEAEGGWVNILPKVEMKLLARHGPSTSFLLRLAPGAELPAHDHPAGEECVVLDGELWLDESLVIRTGDYHYAAAGLPHGVARTDTGALLFLRSDQPVYG